MSSETTEIKLKGFLLIAGKDRPDHIWIKRDDGEGGEFSIDAFSEAVSKFYKENF